jgi:predicted Na+-dependent transporter
MHRLVARLTRLLHGLLQWLIALVILFEEWGWEPLARLVAQLAQLPLIGWLERRIARLPPALALGVFLAPGVLLLPVKLAALALVSHGHVLVGISVIVLAKLLGTAVVARIFQLTQPALLQLAWFARLHGRWIAWKEAAVARVRASRGWRIGRWMRRGLARRLQRWRV